MGYKTGYIRELLENQYGEIIVIMDSDAYDTNPELHLHDTSFDHESNTITIQLADGEVTLDANNIESLAKHEQTTSELGI